ncbi:MAG: hypothetical protein CO030_05215 [Candidatus Magasanikbacteria bacterium CG_4_9_14_0_2_um_filter_42_11]|uniref:YtxH domain-containing protein n=1 Tax=Candidatus Magasanikbacteria bacterium CG_4_9_14_0_2_um_filter_42_11 TaxID=1974643 RepID=A0A2M8F8E3_9BACT|nr:MAG: hypothetical protein COU34_00625 [Candidatus Magasanikbacteria bacterium CG10_big_fil_rev_8_21_14_0_10_43_9]PIY92192.1 MAG: hypothetical protein COY70_04490 [Candidatus Magasanikbacteria bacterium CG_4_10_14_0_8_um_filter_42_12]PJC52003.1 MAG: hypothetical protein CO030_05215 [Candidatus Magasanikbacteria bacterium CG_4_9_14_0_2_um_filter_42_11]
MGKFKKGVVLGGVLGAALVWLNTSTKGKHYRSKLVDQAADVYEKVKQEVEATGAIDNMNKNKYVALVKKTVDKYAIENGMAASVKNTIIRLLSSQWATFKKEVKK